NDGSAARPFATIQHAAEVLLPGATVHVAPGIYDYSTTILTRVSGTATARIRFVSDTRWGAQIRSSADVVWRNDADYVDIVAFDISGDGEDGIDNNGSFVRIIGNHVHDIQGPCGAGGAGIVNAYYPAHDSDIIGNIVHGMGNADCRSHGIYHANLRGHIWNNIVYG